MANLVIQGVILPQPVVIDFPESGGFTVEAPAGVTISPPNVPSVQVSFGGGATPAPISVGGADVSGRVQVSVGGSQETPAPVRIDLGAGYEAPATITLTGPGSATLPLPFPIDVQSGSDPGPSSESPAVPEGRVLLAFPLGGKIIIAWGSSMGPIPLKRPRVKVIASQLHTLRPVKR
jgi:hypothetical protein